MKVLLISATAMESEMLRNHFSLQNPAVGISAHAECGILKISYLHTGIGMVNTAWHLGRAMLADRPDLAVHFGIAGAFENGPAMLDVVEVVQECFAELGADSPDGFLDLEKMGFPSFATAEKNFFNVMEQPQPVQGKLRTCRSVTVNRVSGKSPRIAEMQQIWNPEVENMEGAAFFQACLMEQIPFRSFRCISNLVEPRNRENWKLGESIRKMQQFMIEYVENLAVSIEIG